MTGFDRRAYQRAWRRNRRAAATHAANAHATTCQRRHGQGKCGGVLFHRTDGAGKTITECDACLRRDRGICRDCPRPVEGRVRSAVRCAEHKRVARARQVAQWKTRHHELVKRRQRARYRRQGKAKRAARLAYKKAWRAANRDRVREQKRRSALRRSEHNKAWHAAYRARKAAERRARELARYRGVVELRTCLTCDRVVRGRKKRCSYCLAADKLAAEQLLAGRKGRGRRTDLSGRKAS